VKTLETAFLNSLAGEVNSLAYCWRIERTDEVIIGLTSYSQDLTFAGLTFSAATGFSPTTASMRADGSPSNVELSSVLSSVITAAELRNGAYDYATVLTFLVNPNALPSSLTATPYQYLPLPAGVIGRITHSPGEFSAETLGLASFLAGNFSWVTSPSCRYKFGDANCGLDLEAETQSSFAVVDYLTPSSFQCSWEGMPPDIASGGWLVWESGLNEGLRQDIAKSTESIIYLRSPAPYQIQLGDSFLLQPNCGKYPSHCKFWENWDNFGGESPNLPGLDQYFGGY